MEALATTVGIMLLATRRDVCYAGMRRILGSIHRRLCPCRNASIQCGLSSVRGLKESRMKRDDGRVESEV